MNDKPNAAPQVPALHKGDHDSCRDDQPARASSEAGPERDPALERLVNQSVAMRASPSATDSGTGKA